MKNILKYLLIISCLLGGGIRFSSASSFSYLNSWPEANPLIVSNGDAVYCLGRERFLGLVNVYEVKADELERVYTGYSLQGLLPYQDGLILLSLNSLGNGVGISSAAYLPLLNNHRDNPLTMNKVAPNNSHVFVRGDQLYSISTESNDSILFDYAEGESSLCPLYKGVYNAVYPTFILQKRSGSGISIYDFNIRQVRTITDASLSMIDTPKIQAVVHDNQFIFMAYKGLWSIDLDTGNADQILSLPAQTFDRFTIMGNNVLLYSLKQNVIAVFDLVSGECKDSFQLSVSPNYIAIHDDILYVYSYRGEDIEYVDLNTGHLSRIGFPEKK